MIIQSIYTFADGRIGTLTKSDKFYKTIEREEPNGEKSTETIYYKIRKKGTQEVYDEAIDILSFEYEELTQEEMDRLFSEGDSEDDN